MLELPTNKVVVQPGVPISDSDPLSESGPSGPIKSGTGSHSDAEMQEAAPGDDNDGGNDEGSDGEADSDWTAATAESRQFYTASEALLNEPSRVDPPPPGSHRPEYPAQLSREFEVAGFMYDIPEVDFQPGLNYSKAEQKRACAEFPLVG
ncbi:hypothetical protein LZ554_000568 [Drepanopeziza brunnea f. sp. 'monogermtubi']|nr:hypothetical protein LZ554_000568 [Drepanopeziza brunnea f. sp. 'monogermtubi']